MKTGTLDVLQMKNRQTKYGTSYTRIWLSSKKEWTIESHNMDETSTYFSKWNKPAPKCYILYYSIYMITLKRENYQDEKRLVVTMGTHWLKTQQINK